MKFEAGFNTGDSSSARSIGYQENVSPCLRGGVVPAVVICSIRTRSGHYRRSISKDQTDNMSQQANW